MSSLSKASLLSHSEAIALSGVSDTRTLMQRAAELRDHGFGSTITYSRKVFIPLTHLCRDSCHYCTFARPPRQGEQIYMSPDDVLAVVRKGEAAGCTEALFTLGDKPELRYRQAQSALRALGYDTTLDYLHAMAALVLSESSLLPHLNPGVMTAPSMAMLRPVAASMGLMLEEVSDRLSGRGGVHFGSPDKSPSVRLATVQSAGELNIPFTSGLLIGIGETRSERVKALLALRDLHEAHGHVQEIIIQPFRAKPGTRMATSLDASPDELLWTISVARLIFGPGMSIQTPPNLSPDLIANVIDAGINDWGGISPVTVDYVNPEAPWPHIANLAERMRERGRVLVQRLPLYKSYVYERHRWADASLHAKILSASDSEFMARDSSWASGDATPPAGHAIALPAVRRRPSLDRLLTAASEGTCLSETEIVQLFGARDLDFRDVCQAADELRARVSGETVRYVVNRNINYTNVCSYRCAFCAFSKGKAAAQLRGPAYDLGADEIARRVHEAWARGATEVCMQGGIHPDYTGETYLAVLRAVKGAVLDMHVHAFSPLEVRQGAYTLGLSVTDFLKRLRDAGLGSLPGTAAEILDDDVRAIICPDKLRTQEWLDVIEAAHRIGLKTTATIMYGHVEQPEHWARHLLAIRNLQSKTGGFTEFVPLPFVHMEAPIYFKGRARRGPTWREAVLMHAVARLALHPLVPNIQVSWVKMGIEGAKACLRAGANDLGGTLMNESISRAAGASHGEELPPEVMDEIASSLGRRAEQRTTLYRPAPTVQQRASYGCAPLSPVIQTPAMRHARLSGARSAAPEHF
ncbi:MAG TPA: 5-amino-6-(D-ribitylamino)uracil--L-tyrosine 4-hydroxyphenyl transferase CofH [Pseudolabrys sp.]